MCFGKAFQNNFVTLNFTQIQTLNKIIWMCWFQGEHHHSMPELNQVCIKKWKLLNTDWEINILSYDTIEYYLPEFHKIINNSPKRIIQHKSDLLRLLLLSKYGGVWVDSSVYPMQPLSSFYNRVVNDTGFFTYRFIPRSYKDIGDRETVVWFLCTNSPHHYLIEQWKTQLIKKFQDNCDWKYFTMAEILCSLYDSDKKVNTIINNMVQINQSIPHSASGNWKFRKKSFVYKRPKFN